MKLDNTINRLKFMSQKTNPMLTVNEVAKLLHIHKNTVRRWSDQGIIKSYRITKRGDRRFQKEDITKFLATYAEFNANKTSVRDNSTK